MKKSPRYKYDGHIRLSSTAIRSLLDAQERNGERTAGDDTVMTLRAEFMAAQSGEQQLRDVYLAMKQRREVLELELMPHELEARRQQEEREQQRAPRKRRT